MRRLLVAVICVLAALGGLLVLLHHPQPAALPAGAAMRVPCVSYAPFRREGHSPFDAALVVPPQLIEADLRQLATLSGCVRTYGLDHGLEAVPPIARRLGLRVVLGVWIGRDAAANRDQLARALALAREYADVIELLVVGNEVLLRRELAPQALAALLAHARRESPVPVAYADVWEFWLRHAEVLRPHVDRVAAHVLPYWEDHPVGNAQAADHVHAVAARLREAFAPLPVWVAETGWPAEGRQRGPAVPGRAEQTRFVRELLAREATMTPLRFNLIEGFDQPWKRRLEGAMGGYWGWFDAQGRARVQLEGPLPLPAPARAAAWAAVIGACMGAVLGAIVAARRAQATSGATQPLVGAALGTWLMSWCLVGGALGACAALQWHAWLVWNRTAAEWALSLAMAAAAAGWVLLVLPQLAALMAGQQSAACRPGAVMAWRQHASRGCRWQAAALLALFFFTALMALQLVFDGRYRPLLWPLGGVAAFVALMLALLGERLGSQAREEQLLAALCVALALGLAWIEGAANGQALATAACWLGLASIAWPHRTRLPASSADGVPGRTHTRADNSSPAAAGPAE